MGNRSRKKTNSRVNIYRLVNSVLSAVSFGGTDVKMKEEEAGTIRPRLCVNH